MGTCLREEGRLGLSPRGAVLPKGAAESKEAQHGSDDKENGWCLLCSC